MDHQIAVGMATISPHNLGEIVDGLVALNKDVSSKELMNIIRGP